MDTGDCDSGAHITTTLHGDNCEWSCVSSQPKVAIHRSSEPPPLTMMEDASDDHTDKQYEHGASPPHNPEIVQPRLSAECETADSPKNENPQEKMPVRKSCRQKRPPVWLAE